MKFFEGKHLNENNFLTYLSKYFRLFPRFDSLNLSKLRNQSH